MRLARAAAFALAAALLCGCAAQPGATDRAAPDWRLTQADTLQATRHMVLTVAQDDPAALTALADRLAARYGVAFTAEWPLAAIGVHCFVMEASAPDQVDDLLTRMQDDPDIRTAQRLQDFDTLAEPYTDPLFPRQHGLKRMRIAAAHGLATGAEIRIGVVDTAIDATHPDLAGRMTDQRNFVNAGDAAAEAHGTAIAALIGADGDNRSGIVGVAPRARLTGLRACWQRDGSAKGRCNTFSLARALNFALLRDLEIINLSLAGPDDPLLAELILEAVKRGVLVVAAWGEDAAPRFPASVNGVIGAGRPGDATAPAPAVDVLSAAPGGRFVYVSGSSVAAAHVAGVLALMKERDARLAPASAAAALRRSISPEDGVIDACAALGAVDVTAKCGPTS